MTKTYEDTISVPNEDFVSTMEAFLENEAITKIDVTYYISGGCNLKTYIGNSVKKYYIHDKPANKIGRFNGEMGWLTRDRKDITTTLNASPGSDWTNYVIERIEDESAPDAVSEETTSSSTSSLSRHRYTPLVYCMTPEERAKKSVLSFVMHEMKQPQVEEVSLVSLTFDKSHTSLQITAHDDHNLTLLSDVTVDLDSSTTQEAVDYILANEEYFTTKYSCGITAVKDLDGNVTSLTLTRTPEFSKMTPKYRKERLDSHVYVNGSGGHWNMEDFLRNHLTNKALKSIMVAKRKENDYYSVTVNLNSDTHVQYRLSPKDFPDLSAHLENNFYELMWEGFVQQLLNDSPGEDLEKVLYIYRASSAGYDDDSLYTGNVPLFIRESLDDHQTYELHLSIGDGVTSNGSITVVDAVTDNKTSFDIKTPVEEVKGFITWLKMKAQDLGVQVGAQIECSDDDSWGYYIKARKDIRFSWEWYLKDGNITPDAIDFLTKAYKAGTGIVVVGERNSGKTCFINTLVENAKDDEMTVLLDPKSEIVLPESATNPLVIGGTTSSAWKAALRLSPSRVIFDNSEWHDEKNFPGLAYSVGTNLVMASEKSTSQEYGWTGSAATQYPFEVEVVLGQFGQVVSIVQIVPSGSSYSANVLWSKNDGNFAVVAQPSRNLRRKIEARIEAKEKAVALTAVKNVKAVSSGFDNAKLVTVSESEKQEIRAALALLQSIVDRF